MISISKKLLDDHENFFMDYEKSLYVTTEESIVVEIGGIVVISRDEVPEDEIWMEFEDGRRYVYKLEK